MSYLDPTKQDIKSMSYPDPTQQEVENVSYLDPSQADDRRVSTASRFSRKSVTSSMSKKIKSAFSKPTPEKEAEKETARQQRELEDIETQARIQRMREGIAVANKTGIPQWVSKDEYGKDQYVEGPLGPPKGWVYPEGAYNILTQHGKKLDDHKWDEMAKLQSSVVGFSGGGW